MFEEDYRGEPDPEITPSDMLAIEDPRGLSYTAVGAFTVFYSLDELNCRIASTISPTSVLGTE